MCGENVIVAEGIENIDFSKIISMNETAAYLWQEIKGKSFDAKDLASLLTAEYDVDENTARKDAETLVNQWKQVGIVED